MRMVEWTDKKGYRRRSWVRDEDADGAARHGIRHDPPDVRRLDWEGIKRDLHNALLDRGLLDWTALQRAPQGSLTGAILAVMRVRLISLFREERMIAPGGDAMEAEEVETS